jgi:hypothetical protein
MYNVQYMCILRQWFPYFIKAIKIRPQIRQIRQWKEIAFLVVIFIPLLDIVSDFQRSFFNLNKNRQVLLVSLAVGISCQNEP